MTRELDRDTVRGLITAMRKWIKTAIVSVADEERTPQNVVNELPNLLALLEEVETKVGEGEGLDGPGIR